MSNPDVDTIVDDFVLVGVDPRHPVSDQDGHDYLPSISDAVNLFSPALRNISLQIHDDPELGFREHHAHKLLTDFLELNKWTVTRSAYGMETAFVAVLEGGKTGEGRMNGKGPVVSFNVEYDALPGIGHACGHNLIAVASLAGAMAARRIMEVDGLGGKIVVFGTPAEEVCPYDYCQSFNSICLGHGFVLKSGV